MAPQRHASSATTTTSTAPPQPKPTTTKDTWSSTQYLKFIAPRTRPSEHLATSLPFTTSSSTNNPPKSIVDLGCGPGNSTAVLASRFPSADILGVDSSADMIRAAEKAFSSDSDRNTSGIRRGRVRFQVGDITTWSPPESGGVRPPELYFANAVLHWLSPHTRIELIKRLISPNSPAQQGSGGVTFAFQVPQTAAQPSHTLIPQVAFEANRPWSMFFVGHEPSEKVYPIQSMAEFYDELSPFAANVELWETTYEHVLEGPGEVVEWVRGTGLRPWLEAFDAGKEGEGEKGDAGEAKREFLKEYERRLGAVYERRVDGRVLFGYRRVFGVIVGKGEGE